MCLIMLLHPLFYGKMKILFAYGFTRIFKDEDLMNCTSNCMGLIFPNRSEDSSKTVAVCMSFVSLTICSHCLLSICNIYLFPILVLSAGFGF